MTSDQIGETRPSNRNGLIWVKVYSRYQLMAAACTVAANGYATRSAYIQPRLPRNDITLNKPRTLTGRAVNTDGQPVTGADISVKDERTKTDTRGAFALHISDDRRFNLVASADGYVDKRVVVGERDQELAITMVPLSARGGVFGRVLDPQGRPAWKFTVVAVSTADEEDRINRFVENINGMFALKDLPEGRFTFNFTFVGQDGTMFRANTDALTVLRGQVFGPLTIVCNRPNK